MGQSPSDQDVLARRTEDTVLRRMPVSALCAFYRSSAEGPVMIVAPLDACRTVPAVLPEWSVAPQFTRTYEGGHGLKRLVRDDMTRVFIDAPVFTKAGGTLSGLNALWKDLRERRWRGIVLIGLRPDVFGRVRCERVETSGEPRVVEPSRELGRLVPLPSNAEENEVDRFLNLEFVGLTGPALEVRQNIKLTAGTRARSPVLVQGESGTGQKLVARLIHRLGTGELSGEPVWVMCEAVRDGEMELELCGCVPGAKAEAPAGRVGAFTRAGSGTVFIDDVACLSMGDQARLIKILTDGRYTPVGGATSIEFEARLIAATRSELLRLVADGKFRRDLHYRLAALPIRTPALREIPQDIPAIARHLWAQVLAENVTGRDRETLTKQLIGRIDDEVARVLITYDWPGNARELHSYLVRVLTLAREDPKNCDVALFRGALGAGLIPDAGNGTDR